MLLKKKEPETARELLRRKFKLHDDIARKKQQVLSPEEKLIQQRDTYQTITIILILFVVSLIGVLFILVRDQAK